MTDTAMTTAAEPDGAPRLAVLDILRGVAILGILFMNISDMGGPFMLIFGGDVRTLGWSQADQIAWWLRELFATGTARCLLEMLFGVGIVILTDRAATRMGEGWVLRGYAWRNLVLLAFGLIHVFVLLWPGDILHSYAVAALIAVLFRRARPRLMLTVGLLAATTQLVVLGSGAIGAMQARAAVAALQGREARGATLTFAEQREIGAFERGQVDAAQHRSASAQQIARESADRTGSAWHWVDSAWRSFLYVEQQQFEVFIVWEAFSTMLIGAALYRWGVIQGARSRRFYLGLTGAGYALGLGLRGWVAVVETRFDDLPSLAYATSEFGRLAMTLGHLGLIQLLVASAAGARLLKPFAAAGRAALTLYILQTILCVWVLYPPWGLALYGQQGWAALMATALVVDAALLALAVWWMRRFAIAPVEWAWRSILAGRALPFRQRLTRGEAALARS